MTIAEKKSENHKLEFKKIIPGKREKVFEAWTEPDLIKTWMTNGDKKWVEDVVVDLKVGGSFRYNICVKDNNFPVNGEYIEIDFPNKLVFTWHAPWLKGANTVVTIIFNDLGKERTEMIMIHDNFPTEELRDNNFKGWSEIIDNIQILKY